MSFLRGALLAVPASPARAENGPVAWKPGFGRALSGTTAWPRSPSTKRATSSDGVPRTSARHPDRRRRGPPSGPPRQGGPSSGEPATQRVLKLNHVRASPPAFTRTSRCSRSLSSRPDRLDPVKLTMTSHEWCGNSFAEWRRTVPRWPSAPTSKTPGDVDVPLSPGAPSSTTRSHCSCAPRLRAHALGCPARHRERLLFDVPCPRRRRTPSRDRRGPRVAAGLSRGAQSAPDRPTSSISKRDFPTGLCLGTGRRRARCAGSCPAGPATGRRTRPATKRLLSPARSRDNRESCPDSGILLSLPAPSARRASTARSPFRALRGTARNPAARAGLGLRGRHRQGPRRAARLPVHPLARPGLSGAGTDDRGAARQVRDPPLRRSGRARRRVHPHRPAGSRQPPDPRRAFLRHGQEDPPGDRAPEVRLYQALEKYYGERRTPRFAILAEKLTRPTAPSGHQEAPSAAARLFGRSHPVSRRVRAGGPVGRGGRLESVRHVEGARRARNRLGGTTHFARRRRGGPESIPWEEMPSTGSWPRPDEALRRPAPPKLPTSVAPSRARRPGGRLRPRPAPVPAPREVDRGPLGRDAGRRRISSGSWPRADATRSSRPPSRAGPSGSRRARSSWRAPTA